MWDDDTPPVRLRKAECANCRGVRTCAVHGNFETIDNEGFYRSSIVWRILQCRGCERVFVEVATTVSNEHEWEPDDRGQMHQVVVERSVYFPPLAKRVRPEWLSTLGIDRIPNPPLDQALLEIYEAVDAGLNMLAGMGIRAAFDVAAKMLGVEDRLPFQEKLKALKGRGLIGAEDETNLEILVDAGHAATHRGWRPNNQEIGTLMDILEGFVGRALVAPWRQQRLKYAAAQVKAGVPPRPPRAAELGKPLPPKTS